MSRTNSEMKLCGDGVYRPIPRPRTFEESVAIFWSRVEIKSPTECWIWEGMTKRQPNGFVYGVFWAAGRQIKAHRFALMVKIGKLGPGTLSCHTCDTPLCCNPNHLFASSYLGNNQDACVKGRHAFGEDAGLAKLTREKVLEIRNLYVPFARGYKVLAKRFSVSPSAIQAVIERRSWKHL